MPIFLFYKTASRDFPFQERASAPDKKWELMKPSEPVFLDGLWLMGEYRYLEFRRNQEWNWVSHFPQNFNIQRRNRLFILCWQLPYCLRVGNFLTNKGCPSPHTHNIWQRQFWNLQFLHTDLMSPRNNPQQNLFLTRNRFLKSLKIWTSDRSSVCFLFEGDAGLCRFTIRLHLFCKLWLKRFASSFLHYFLGLK